MLAQAAQEVGSAAGKVLDGQGKNEYALNMLYSP
jgi:hypothetical protein